MAEWRLRSLPPQAPLFQEVLAEASRSPGKNLPLLKNLGEDWMHLKESDPAGPGLCSLFPHQPESWQICEVAGARGPPWVRAGWTKLIIVKFDVGKCQNSVQEKQPQPHAPPSLQTALSSPPHIFPPKQAWLLPESYLTWQGQCFKGVMLLLALCLGSPSKAEAESPSCTAWIQPLSWTPSRYLKMQHFCVPVSTLLGIKWEWFH